MDTQLIDLRNILSLTDFRRRAAELVGQLEESGRPLVLTVNGRAELVVVSADAFQRLLELAEFGETVQGLKEGLDAMDRGEGKDAKRALEEIRRRYAKKIPSRNRAKGRRGR